MAKIPHYYVKDDFMLNWWRQRKSLLSSSFRYLVWLNHWMKADVALSNMVSAILADHGLKQVLQYLLWSLNSVYTYITMYFIVSHHTCASSVAWGMIIFVDCFLSIWKAFMTKLSQVTGLPAVRVLYSVAAPHQWLCLMTWGIAFYLHVSKN